MTQSISAGELFEAVHKRLGLTWVAGKEGHDREILVDEKQSDRPSLVGFLNLVHPNAVQILGNEELQFLAALDDAERKTTLADIIRKCPVAIIFADGRDIPDEWSEPVRTSPTPVWKTDHSGTAVVGQTRHFLSRRLARNTTMHGVFMEVFSIGVLITGDPGAGKSELALELITRGHRLIGDDAPEMTQIAPDIIDGTCPDVLQDCLEVRGLGVLNVRAMFGDNAVKGNKYLRLIIHLKLMSQGVVDGEMDRLRGDYTYRPVLGLDIPVITIPVAPGRNIAVLVEAAVRNHILKMKGFDAAREFIRRHNEELRVASSS